MSAAESKAASAVVNIGVLALQGAFAEHKRSLAAVDGVRVSEVRSADDLAQVEGLIIPGGESVSLPCGCRRVLTPKPGAQTTISLIASKDNMVGCAVADICRLTERCACSLGHCRPGCNSNGPRLVRSDRLIASLSDTACVQARVLG